MTYHTRIMRALYVPPGERLVGVVLLLLIVSPIYLLVRAHGAEPAWYLMYWSFVLMAVGWLLKEATKRAALVVVGR